MFVYLYVTALCFALGILLFIFRQWRLGWGWISTTLILVGVFLLIERMLFPGTAILLLGGIIAGLVIKTAGKG